MWLKPATALSFVDHMGPRSALSIQTSATSEHHVRLHLQPLEATVDGGTWLTGFIRFGMDGHVRGPPHQAAADGV